MGVYTGTADLVEELITPPEGDPYLETLRTPIEDLCYQIKGHLETEGWIIPYSVFDHPEISSSRPATFAKSTVSYGPFVRFRPYPTTNKLEFRTSTEFGIVSFTTTAWNTQPDSSTNFYLNLYDGPMPYWLVVNKRRMLIIVNADDRWSMAYCGHHMSFRTPKSDPNPIFISGNGTSSTAEDTQSPNFVNGMYHQGPDNYAGALTFGSLGDEFSTGVNLDESYNLYQLAFQRSDIDRLSGGELEGVFKVNGTGLASGDTITVGADSYLVVQDHMLTGPGDFYAIRLV